MDYSLDELYPVFERLSRRYMGADTSSIPYEKAQSLMRAVIYCINHFEQMHAECVCGETLCAMEGHIPAKEAYTRGLEAVREKTCHAVKIYESIMSSFDSFGNRACYDTVAKGIPEFFKWYDPEYDPENHMLTFDYPILRQIDSLSGIDAIFTYLECIRYEQDFLKGFSPNAVINVLQLENSGYTELFENICRPVVRRAVMCMIVGCEVANLQLTREDFDLICYRLENCGEQKLQQILEKAIETLIKKCYNNDLNLLSYLRSDMHSFAFEFINASRNNYLNKLIPCN